MIRCPGQDQRFWKSDDIFEIKCPDCGTAVEFWKDEPKQKCPRCKRLIANPRLDLGCAKWCQFAHECLGAVAEGGDLCSRLIAEIREIFAADPGRINHSLKTLMYAEHIQVAEGGEPLVVKAAAILHEISASDTEQILSRHDVKAEVIKKICAVINPDVSNARYLESKILSDAHKLADFQATFPYPGNIAAAFETGHGRKLANQMVDDLRNTGKSHQ